MIPKAVAMIFLTDDIDLITKKYNKCLHMWTSLQGKLKYFFNVTSSMGALNSTTVFYETCFHSIRTSLDVYKELIYSHFFSSIIGTSMNVEKTKVMRILRNHPQ
jgi:hypothetical protein